MMMLNISLCKFVKNYECFRNNSSKELIQILILPAIRNKMKTSTSISIKRTPKEFLGITVQKKISHMQKQSTSTTGKILINTLITKVFPL